VQDLDRQRLPVWLGFQSGQKRSVQFYHHRPDVELQAFDQRMEVLAEQAP
jgi:hypothetical protein